MKNEMIMLTIAEFLGRTICDQCGKENTAPYWCQPCNSSNFRREFDNWKSGNVEIDAFIKKVQLEATSGYGVLEWIPYSKFKNVTPIAKGGFGEVYSAEWTEGRILCWDVKNNQWMRGAINVALKCLDDSQNISSEFLDVIRNHHNCNDDFYITRCFGITRHDTTNDHMIVIQLVDRGSIRNHLSKFYEMVWEEKLETLFRIAKGLNQIHEAKLVHRNLHPGNVLLSSSNAIYVTDLGLFKPINEYDNSEDRKQRVYGVLPYVAPEVLRGEEHTEAADVYAFGITMSEILSGTPPFNTVPHDNVLAIRICNGLRPKIPSNVPALLVELIRKCWDVEPSKRLNANELCIILSVWRYYLGRPNSRFARQIKEIENKPSNSLKRSATHPSAIYTSRLLNFRNLPKPKNSNLGK